MATHHCIGIPCWFCYPEFAPKQEEENYNFPLNVMQSYTFKDNNISSSLEEMLIKIFQSGIDEDEHFRCNQDLTLEKIKEERLCISDDSFEAKLLDIMITDFESKVV
jgi:hypothetical protein